jgi:hypothetical protein
MHDVLSAILRTAVKWGHLPDNPARGVDLPTLKTVKPKWALTITQGSALLNALPPLARTMVGLALMTGLRRGEMFDRGRGRVRRCVRNAEDQRWAASRSAVRGHGEVVGGVARAAKEHPTRRTGVRHVVGEAHFAQQRAASLGVSGVRGAQPAERDLADVPAHLGLVGSRQGVPGKVVAS